MIIIWICYAVLLSDLVAIMSTWFLVVLFVGVVYSWEHQIKLKNACMRLKIQGKYLFVEGEHIKGKKILLRSVVSLTFNKQHLSLLYKGAQQQDEWLEIPRMINYSEELKVYLTTIAKNNQLAKSQTDEPKP